MSAAAFDDAERWSQRADEIWESEILPVLDDYIRISTPAGTIVLTRDHLIGGRPADEWGDGEAMALQNGEVVAVNVRPATSEVSGDLRLEGDSDYVTAGGFIVGSMLSQHAVGAATEN